MTLTSLEDFRSPQGLPHGSRGKERIVFDDLAAAQKFYARTLGLRISEQYGLLRLHLAGGP